MAGPVTLFVPLASDWLREISGPDAGRTRALVRLTECYSLIMSAAPIKSMVARPASAATRKGRKPERADEVRVKSRSVRKGRVVDSDPGAGATRSAGARVRLYVRR